MGQSKSIRMLMALRNYAIFFFLIAFVITCCITLFLRTMQSSMNLTLAEGDIKRAAVLTFVNTVFLSLLCTVVDTIRRKISVERPLKRILTASERIMKGDFSARIKSPHGLDSGLGFELIIDHFNRMAEELGGLETLRTDFISNVSHELKTPLAAIQNYSTLLQTPGLSDQQRIEYAKSIHVSSRKLTALITNILKLNKLENQQLYPETKVYHLGEQLCENLLAFEDFWEQNNITIETQIEEDIYVESDPELLALVWNNLFSNALKFTKANGKVSLSLQSEGSHAIIEVADTGCGISPETGRHIFEKFYQGDTSHATQGNGLGLALVKRVIDIVGAEISVQSEVGKGSIFTVKIRRITDAKT